jgi:BirA family transcriptional regulator, biotin operon repressor / biotin---[acetyl-CoA-carboxylase] ligase
MAEWPAGTLRSVFDEIDSTNAEAARHAAAGTTGPAWFLGRVQLQGRGRRGRPWSSPRGNFHASYLSMTSGGPGDAALRSFTASLALFDTLVHVTGRAAPFSLKWPNDVLLSGQKLAGILLESCPTPGALPSALAIGFGVNLADTPHTAEIEPAAVSPVSLAAATGIAVAPEEFLDMLAPNLQGWESVLVGEGFGPVRAAWLARAARLGEEITARLPDREVRGIFRTLDETGAIQIETDRGRVNLPAAEIYFGPQQAGVGSDHASRG